MVASVEEAVAWMQNNADAYGGNRSKLCVIGQSAGTQLTSMCFLEQSMGCVDSLRSKKSLCANPNNESSEEVNGECITIAGREPNSFTASKDGLPSAFLALNGIYQLEHHYQFEELRGVAGISMMKRCMRGDLAKWSPQVYLPACICLSCISCLTKGFRIQ